MPYQPDPYEAWLVASATRQELSTLLEQAEQEPERYLLSGATGLPGYRRAMTERLEALGEEIAELELEMMMEGYYEDMTGAEA